MYGKKIRNECFIKKVYLNHVHQENQLFINSIIVGLVWCLVLGQVGRGGVGGGGLVGGSRVLGVLGDTFVFDVARVTVNLVGDGLAIAGLLVAS